MFVTNKNHLTGWDSSDRGYIHRLNGFLVRKQKKKRNQKKDG